MTQVSRMVKSDMGGLYLEHLGWKCRLLKEQDEYWIDSRMLREGVYLTVMNVEVVAGGGIKLTTRLNAVKIYWRGAKETE